jgi:pyridoxine 5'-phosphate synthase PdxJ
LQANYIAEIQKIALAARLATRNHMRISVGGQLQRRLIWGLLELIDIEFISVGLALLGQALVTGMEMAIREYLMIIENK